MPDGQGYLSLASEAERMAEDAQDPHMAAHYRELAMTYRRIAELLSNGQSWFSSPRLF